jgi:hypothetical protein
MNFFSNQHLQPATHFLWKGILIFFSPLPILHRSPLKIDRRLDGARLEFAHQSGIALDPAVAIWIQVCSHTEKSATLKPVCALKTLGKNDSRPQETHHSLTLKNYK